MLFIAALFIAGMMACSGEVREEAGDNSEDVVEQGSDEEVSDDMLDDDEQEFNSEVGASQIVMIYYSNSDADGFYRSEAELEALTEEKLWSELLERSNIPADVLLLSFTQNDANGGRITLDLSESFHVFVRGLGTSGEYLAIGSIVNTFLSAYEAKGVRITVEGQVLETGHAEYTGYLEVFE